MIGRDQEKAGGAATGKTWATTTRQVLDQSVAMRSAERAWLSHRQDGLRCEPQLPLSQSYKPEYTHSDRFKMALDLWTLDRRLLQAGKALWDRQGDRPVEPGCTRLAAELVECLEQAGNHKALLKAELLGFLPKAIAKGMQDSQQASEVVRRLGEDTERMFLEASLGLHLMMQMLQRRLAVVQDLGGLGMDVLDKRAKYLQALRSRFDLGAAPAAPLTVQALLERGWAFLERPEVGALAQPVRAVAAAKAPVVAVLAAAAAPAATRVAPEGSPGPGTLAARNRDAKATAEAEAQARREHLETLRRRRELRKEAQAAAKAGAKPRRSVAVPEPALRVQDADGPLPVVWHPQAYKEWLATKDGKVQSSLARTSDLLGLGGLDYCLGHELAKALARNGEVYELRPHGAAKALRPLFMVDQDRILVLSIATKKNFDASVDLAAQRAAATPAEDFQSLEAFREGVSK